MSSQIISALISGTVALAVAGVGGLLTWSQVRRERIKWLVDVKASYTIKLYETRLNSYPELLKTISRISTRSISSVTPTDAQAIAAELNSWFYSAGGLCADSRTRGAVLGLRECCDYWARNGKRPKEFFEIRNAALTFMRRDLDLGGLESYDFSNTSTLLAELQADLDSIKSKKKTSFPSRMVSARDVLLSKEADEPELWRN
jgi:hypothetical protein